MMMRTDICIVAPPPSPRLEVAAEPRRGSQFLRKKQTGRCCLRCEEKPERQTSDDWQKTKMGPNLQAGAVIPRQNGSRRSLNRAQGEGPSKTGQNHGDQGRTV
ncbi:hypothetical protein GBF38_000562 [Nibea albiflora]|nr:hypothetical protein GBF38_000562 [Nibea albiflora]